MTTTYRMRDLCSITGLSRQAIHFYIQQGLVPEGTKTGLTALHAKAFLLTKARCPSWILVVTSISNALITLTVFVATILVFLVVTGHPPSIGAVALFLGYCGALTAIVVGFSLLGRSCPRRLSALPGLRTRRWTANDLRRNINFRYSRGLGDHPPWRRRTYCCR